MMVRQKAKETIHDMCVENELLMEEVRKLQKPKKWTQSGACANLQFASPTKHAIF